MDVAGVVFAGVGAGDVPVAHVAVLASEAGLPSLGTRDGAGDLVLKRGESGGAGAYEGRSAVAGVGMVVVGGAVALLAHVAAHGAHGHEHLGQVLGTVAAGHREVVQQPHVVLLAKLASVLGDALGRNAADIRGPLGGLRGLVVLASDVILEVDVFFQVGRLVLGVEADGVLVKEVPVDDVALFLVQAQHLVGNAQKEGGVRAAADGDPVGIEQLGGCGVDGVDGDELHARFLGADVVVAGQARSRPGRVR